MCSDVQCQAYAHEYGKGFSELPEESTSFQEMPGSFPPDEVFELETSTMQKSDFEHVFNSLPYTQAASTYRQSYNANQSAMMRKPLPVSATYLPQLSRLEVPESHHRVPRLMSDHCSITPSPISPVTPMYEANAAPYQAPNSLSPWHSLSPCTIPEKGQMYAHYGHNGQVTQQSPGTPSMTYSYNSSSNTTPLSAHPSTAHTLLYAWPQSQNEPSPPMYSQTYSPVYYNQNSYEPRTADMFQRQGDMHAQPYYDSSFRAPQVLYPQTNFNIDQSHQNPSFHAPTSYEPHTQKPELHTQLPEQHTQLPGPLTTDTHPDHTYDETLPAYTPAVPTPRIPTNPLRRYPPSACQQCEKVFTGKFGPGNLRRHVLQTHGSVLDRARHMCQECLKTYNRADALRKHSWKKHRQEDARPNKRRT